MSDVNFHTDVCPYASLEEVTHLVAVLSSDEGNRMEAAAVPDAGAPSFEVYRCEGVSRALSLPLSLTHFHPSHKRQSGLRLQWKGRN